MVGPSSARVHGNDRFYYPPARRQREQQQQQNQQLHQSAPTQRPARSRQQPAPAPAPAAPPPPRPETRDSAESRVESDDSSSKPSVVSSSPSPPPPAGNLDRFLESTTPVVAAHFFPKSLRGRTNCDAAELHPYFCLSDLWESFKEWSAYGAGVPLVLNGSDSVVQYYVPYLSAIQLYADTTKPALRFRQPDEESDGDTFMDTSSDSSSESEISDRIRERTTSGTTGLNGQMNFIGDDGEICTQAVLPVFEYLERDPPYGREPLADKISALACKFPRLKTYRSCDLLADSWMSVAWYPIYRIPTGPTLKDLDACFLTYHFLSTPISNASPNAEVLGTPILRNLKNSNGMFAKLALPAFALASYKFRFSIWTSNALHERQQASSLLQGADYWLRSVQVDHPDYRFFMSHFNNIRR